MWTVCGMKMEEVNQILRKKKAPVALCPLQIPHDLTGIKAYFITIRTHF
jgi:hypothetical protein